MSKEWSVAATVCPSKVPRGYAREPESRQVESKTRAKAPLGAHGRKMQRRRWMRCCRDGGDRLGLGGVGDRHLGTAAGEGRHGSGSQFGQVHPVTTRCYAIPVPASQHRTSPRDASLLAKPPLSSLSLKVTPTPWASGNTTQHTEHNVWHQRQADTSPLRAGRREGSRLHPRLGDATEGHIAHNRCPARPGAQPRRRGQGVAHSRGECCE